LSFLSSGVAVTLGMRTIVVVALAGLVMRATADSASGQVGIGSDQRPSVPRPYRGIFGASSRPDRAQLLDVTASIGAGYDDNVLARESASVTRSNRYARSGHFGTAQAGITFGRSTDRMTADLTGGVSSRIFPEGDLEPVLARRISGSLSARLGARNTVAFAGSAFWAPYYTVDLDDSGFGAFDVNPAAPPSGFDVGDTDQPVEPLPAQRAFWLGRFSRRISSRSDLSLDYRMGRVAVGDGLRQQRMQGGRAAWTYRVARWLDARVGYGYRELRPVREGEALPTLAVQAIDVGLGYGHGPPLALSRRTTLSFGTGATGLVRESAPGERRVTYRLTGNATLAHQFGHSGLVSLTYVRSVRFLGGLSEALAADTVGATVTGHLGRRLSANAVGTYRWATLSGSGGRLEGVRASTSAQFALGRSVALYATWFYYDYDFDREVALPPGVPPATERQGVRAGLSVWVPALR
jgi:hypothetical protein